MDNQDKITQSKENSIAKEADKNVDMGDPVPGNILVVDDNPQNLRLLIAILTMHGYKVRPAPNGELAIKSIFSTPPDIILLDIMMPEMDGYQVCQKLKESEETRAIPIIFISAIDAIAEKIKAFEMGAVDYITKPFHAEEILARVNTHLTLRKTQKQLEDEIEKRKASEEALRAVSIKYQKMATQDYLTGVSNRRHFMERAEEELNRAKRYSRPLTFLMMDIDHFKKINDTYGHQAGDYILKQVSTTCLDNLRLNDIFGRIGGEEFCALLPETSYNDAMVVAERIRKSIEGASWQFDNSVISCTMSIGMSGFNISSSNLVGQSLKEEESRLDGQSIDQLIKQADEALYLAKSSGRNQVK
ncbi:MAG: diguanylate cyclase [Desulfamplus sp.]|nr:diguanylate cyclase [Desulfamplus sp.]